MVDETIEETKARLREQVRRRRSGLSSSDRAEAAKAVSDWFFRGIALAPGDVVAAYWPLRDELDCQPILLKLFQSGYSVCLPVVTGPDQPLQLRLWEEGQPLEAAGFGTLAPGDLAPTVEPDVMLIPLLGFDSRGTRLGYGGGHYDRTLAALATPPRVVGLAFAAQEIEFIPRGAHDIPLDAVVTELGYRTFGPAV